MKKVFVVSTVICLFISSFSFADTFGTGANQFTIDFVTISGDNGDLGSWSAGYDYTFSGVNHGDYRIGTYEITNDQWNKFQVSYGTVNGTPSDAYDENPTYSGINIPINEVSWYEAAQFVNWLNTSNGYQPAYNFTGTQGTSSYTMDVWDVTEAWGGTNLYRHKDAFYFLPTESEWVKAAYWNGTNLQTYTTHGDTLPVAGIDTNFQQKYPDTGPWDVGSGREEINGTYDMMGNVYEWMEGPFYPGDYFSYSGLTLRGGSSFDSYPQCSSPYRVSIYPGIEYHTVGFRVASVVPEPATLSLLIFGGFLLRIQKR